MKNKNRMGTLILLWGLCAISAPATAQDCADIRTMQPTLDLIPFIHYAQPGEYLEVPWRALPTVAFSRSPADANGFNYMALGLDQWLRICLRNSTDTERRLVLSFEPAIIAELDFYPQDGSPSFQTGLARPFNSRDIDAPTYSFATTLAAGETKSYYLRIHSSTPVTLYGRLFDADEYQASLRYQAGFYGILAGVFLGLILYNLMLYVTVRQLSALLYVGFASTIFLTLNFFDGRVFQYVLSDYPRLNYELMFLAYYLVSLVGGLFSRSYLKLARYPILDRISIGIMALFSMAMLLAYLISIVWYLRVGGLFAVTTIVFYVGVVGLTLVVKGSVEARYYLLALSPFMLVAMDRTLVNLGINSHYFVPYDPLAGLAATMILLAYGVGRTLHADKDKAQQLALEQLQKVHQLQTSYSEKLEQNIAKATAEIRTKNEVLARRAQQLTDMEGARSTFFANISHEFRTPLTLIQGPLHALKSELSDRDKSAVQGVLRQTRQLQNLIDQLLTLSKFDSDSLELQTRRLDVVKLVRQLTSQFTSYAEQKGIALNFQSSRETLAAYVDTEKLQIVINNLLSNAVKFTDKNGRIDVELSIDGLPEAAADDFDPDNLSRDAYVQIAVTDTGCGIAESDLPYVFDRYFQVRRSNVGQQQGTGIGLSLARDLVNLHVGQIKVTSIENVGSRFVVQLPLGSAHLKPGEILIDEQEPGSDKPAEVSSEYDKQVRPPVPDPAETASAEHKSATILIVDDNPDMRDYLSALLQPYYRLLLAEDGMHAEEVLAVNVVSLIITDLMMPRRDGLSLIERLRQDARFAHTPIIMLTAKAGQADKLIGLEACADDYLAKPFDARELLARISNLLKKQEQLRVFYGDTSASQALAAALPERELISRMRRIVEARLHEESFGVEELAGDLFMSSPTLRRRLSEISTYSPSDFIRQCRLEKARELAATGRYRTLASLANAVGFNQTSYFSRLYQKTFNCPPFSAVYTTALSETASDPAANPAGPPAQIDQ